MKRLLLCAVAVVVALLASPTLVSADGAADEAAAAAAAAPRFRHYVACGTTAAATPSHRCAKGAKKAAFFKSLDRDATYKVCVKFPSGKKLCATAQDAPEDDLRVNTITSKKIGQHTVIWVVAGKRVGLYTFRVFK